MRNPFKGIFGQPPEPQPQPAEAAPSPPAGEPKPKRNPADHLAGYRWKPGQSGNPGGRPKGKSITAWLNDALADLDDNGEEAGQAIAKALIALAADGDVAAARVVLERTEGRVKQEVALGGEVALSQTVFYIPTNGRDDRTAGDTPAAGPADAVPGDPG